MITVNDIKLLIKASNLQGIRGKLLHISIYPVILQEYSNILRNISVNPNDRKILFFLQIFLQCNKTWGHYYKSVINRKY